MNNLVTENKNINKKKATSFDKYLSQNHYADLEARGFWEDVNTSKDVWCLCSITDDDTVILWHDFPELNGVVVTDPYDNKEYTIPERAGSLLEGARYWYKIGRSKGTLVVHNAYTYDKPIIEKIWPKCIIPDSSWCDTFTMSKVQWFDRPCPKGAKSAHGLKAYGILCGVNKPEITDFSVFDANMLHRVIEDCRIQKETYTLLKKEQESLEALGVDLKEAIALENQYAANCQRQEVYGASVDKEHILRCIDFLDSETERLSKDIEPQLPPTVKAKSVRISRGEMAKLFGMPPIPEAKDEDGKVIKQYYKPVVKYTREIKGYKYKAFNLSYGDTPTFNKRKELTDYIKATYISKDKGAKLKDWDIEKEECNKEVLNSNTCLFFGVEETSDLIGGAFTKVEFSASKMTQHDVVKGYLIKNGLKYVDEWNIKKDDNGMVRCEQDTLVVYPKKAAPENQISILCKKGQPLYTTPKLSEKDYEQLPDGLGKDIATYNTYMHRRRFLANPKDPEEKGLLANIREDGRLPCGVNNFSTSTGRSSHRVWANPAGEGALYGKEIRSCIKATEGKVLVSSDMNSAQLSIAAYYANNQKYFKAVCYGNEFKVDDKGNEILHPDTQEPWYIGESGHCVNSMAFGLVSEEEHKVACDTQDAALIKRIHLARKKSKGLTFACIFGAAGKKLGAMAGVGDREGARMKDLFLANIGLERPIAILEQMRNKYKRGKGGYIELPFGYYAYSASPHSAFNFLDQGTEAACQKWAELYFEREAKKRGLNAYKVLSYHDEFTAECTPDIVEDVKALMNESYYEASIALWEWHKKHSEWFVGDDLPSFHIELQAGAKAGTNYWDVH